LTASHRGEPFAFYWSRYYRALSEQHLQPPFHFQQAL
jgi:hypothetical protein